MRFVLRIAHKVRTRSRTRSRMARSFPDRARVCANGRNAHTVRMLAVYTGVYYCVRATRLLYILVFTTVYYSVQYYCYALRILVCTAVYHCVPLAMYTK